MTGPTPPREPISREDWRAYRREMWRRQRRGEWHGGPPAFGCLFALIVLIVFGSLVAASGLALSSYGPLPVVVTALVLVAVFIAIGRVFRRSARTLDELVEAVARVEELAENSRSRTAFLCGSAENEEDIYHLFDRTVSLVIDDEDLLRHRLATRTTNSFGQHPEELAATLMWNPRLRPLYESLGATIIDASRPLPEVVDGVLAAGGVRPLPDSGAPRTLSGD